LPNGGVLRRLRQDNPGAYLAGFTGDLLIQLFSGIVLEIECPVNMPTIAFYPDFGETLNKLYGWATKNTRPPFRLAFPDESFEAVFEVYTDGLKNAKKLLQFFHEYQSNKKHISAAFQGQKFYLAIDLSHDFMSFKVTNEPLSESNDAIHRALRDVTIPRRIIDILCD
jgi:hypothetical protein